MTDMFEKQLEMSFRAKMLAGKLVQSENERLAEPCWNCGNGTGFVNSQFAVVCDSCYEVVEE
jgi:ribosomal protein S27E